VDQLNASQLSYANLVAAFNGILGSGGTATPSASTSDGGVSVAAAIAVNLANSTVRAYVPASLAVTAGGTFTLTANNQTDASADADGSAVDAVASTGVGAAVAL